MRYLYAKLTNYIGLYNGMGLETIEIDFTKCKNNIILITGHNGCGKSTLMDALSPFPDSNNSFVPNKDAEKILRLFDNGDIYDIRISYPADNKGGRKQSKAFISKNGLELNTNGNITSFKETLFSEFELDANYLSLTKLSSTDRGLGDKTPAERKKFASNIVDNLETYNDIYKTLNKKSLVFKSHINTLHTKIQNIGNKENLEMTLNSLKKKAEYINSNISYLNNSIVELQTRNSINQEEARDLQELNDKMNILVAQRESLLNNIFLSKKKTKINETDIQNKYNEDLNLRANYLSKKESSTTKWKSESEKLQMVNNSINEAKANIELMSTSIDKEIENKYNILQRDMKNIYSSIESRGIDLSKYNIQNIIFRLSNLIESCPEFIYRIDNIYESLTNKDLNYICLNYDSNMVNKLSKKINDCIMKIESNNLKLSEIRDNIKTISILENRPIKCNIDSCPFISQALDIKNSIGDIDLLDQLSKMQEENLKLSNTVSQIQKDIELYNLLDRKYMELDKLMNDIFSFSDINYIINNDIYLDKQSFRVAFSNNYHFNEYRDPKYLIDILNDLRILSNMKESYVELKAKYIATKDNITLLNKNKDMIEKLEKESLDYINNINRLKLDVDNYTSLINSLDISLSVEKKYLDDYLSLINILEKITPIENRIKEIESKSSESINSISKINEMKMQIDNLSKELVPITNDIQKISGQLTMLESYYIEYDQYKSKYNMIETIKKYCSPTGGGIQTLFMQLYMSKTLELANQILGMLFCGEYKLLDFIINQNEFRIPFVGSGMVVDDISSGSASQIAIMGMAINLSLFYQASSKFNIARLDEVDGALDHRNRMGFVNDVLYKALPMLNIEQLFIISHSIETDNSAVDIIKLKSYDDFSDGNDIMGNIIYDYSKEISKTFI